MMDLVSVSFCSVRNSSLWKVGKLLDIKILFFQT